MPKSGKSKTVKSIKVNDNKLKLPIRDICSIIKTCRKNNVLSLKFEGLELMLGTAETKSITYDVTSEEKPEFAKDEKEAINDLYNSYELEQLKVNEPEEYERLVAGEVHA